MSGLHIQTPSCNFDSFIKKKRRRGKRQKKKTTTLFRGKEGKIKSLDEAPSVFGFYSVITPPSAFLLLGGEHFPAGM